MKKTLVILTSMIVIAMLAAFSVASHTHTRSIVIQIEGSSVSDFEAMSKSLPDALDDVELLRSPGTDLWLLSVRASSDAGADQRMMTLTTFLHEWGVKQSHHPGRGTLFGSAILEHERTKGFWGRLRARFNGSVPFFR
jgi:hypothetical protein